ncbi:helix-turn-helix transcriptional regulator [Eggerthella guodeyinii]|uniref:Helix-turn-helix transcriptional regulator n=1 Tax=Eggerthella guodeyinii TaxID=2690837 RepID=A0A6L7IUW2_9ACTN|nr:AraC family transcriptional regulator [Eggerthella guodeyinii]QOS69252.1 helix-turn-helix transcriptional regulator [Eggerthella guodeyinii]
MYVVTSVNDLFENYASMGAVGERTPRGQRFSFDRGDDLRGTTEFLGDPRTFSLAVADYTVPRDFVSRTRFEERYLGITFNDRGSVETYRRRDDARVLDEGLHCYVEASPTPFFMRIAAGTRLHFTALYFMERFFDENRVALPDDFWAMCSRVLNVGEHSIPGLGLACRQIQASQLEGMAWQAFMRGQGLVVAGLIIDYVESRVSDEREQPDEALRDSVMRAKAALKAEYAHPPTVEALARRVGTNKNRLQAGFARLEGKTVSEYLRGVRMGRALDLLAETDLPVEAVAQHVGYQGKANFYRAFRDAYGYAPAEVRTFLHER